MAGLAGAEYPGESCDKIQKAPKLAANTTLVTRIVSASSDQLPSLLEGAFRVPNSISKRAKVRFYVPFEFYHEIIGVTFCSVFHVMARR